MTKLMRACAIYTGAVASLCLVISLTWWADPSFGNRTGSAVLAIAFLSGLLGFFVMFAILFARGVERRRADVPLLISTILKRIPRLLLLWLVVVAVAAIVSFGIAWGRAGKWEAAAPYSDAPAGCHWPLYANHDTEHLCVSHARWLDVNLQTAHIFVGFGVMFLIIDCAAFTILSRSPRRPRKAHVSEHARPPAPARLPFPPPPAGSHRE